MTLSSTWLSLLLTLSVSPAADDSNTVGAAPPPSAPSGAEAAPPSQPSAPAADAAAAPAPTPGPTPAAPPATDAAAQPPPSGPVPAGGPTPAAPTGPVPAETAPSSAAEPPPQPQPAPRSDSVWAPTDSLDASDGSPSTLPRTLTVVHRREPLPTTPPPPPPESVPTRRDRFFVSGYGGVDFRVSTLSRKFATLVGVRGGLLLGKRISLGAAMYRVSKRWGPPIIDGAGRPMTLKAQYGGATVGASLVRGKTVELAVHGLIGAGIGCVSYNLEYGPKSYRCVETVKMMVAEPSVVLHIHPTRWMRLGLEAGYRAVARESWRPPNDFSMSGGFGGFHVEFGWFDRDD